MASEYVINPYNDKSDTYPDGSIHVVNTDTGQYYPIDAQDSDMQTFYRKTFPVRKAEEKTMGKVSAPQAMWNVLKDNLTPNSPLSSNYNPNKTPYQNNDPVMAAAVASQAAHQAPAPPPGAQQPTQDQLTHQAFMNKFGGGNHLAGPAATTANILNQYQQQNAPLEAELNRPAQPPVTPATATGPRTELAGPQAYEAMQNAQMRPGLIQQEQGEIEAAGAAQDDLAKAQQAKRDELAKAYQEQQAKQQDLEVRRQAALKTATDKYNTLVDTLDKDKPTPWGLRGWDSWTDGKAWANNIGVSMQVLGSALLTAAAIKGHGDPSTGTKFLDAQIKNQMDREQQRLEKERQSVNAQKGMLDSLTQSFGNEQAGLDAGYALSYHKVGNELDNLMAQSKSQEQLSQLKIAKIHTAQQETQHAQAALAESTKVALEGARTEADIAAKQDEMMGNRANAMFGKPVPQALQERFDAGMDLLDKMDDLKDSWNHGPTWLSGGSLNPGGTLTNEYLSKRRAAAGLLAKLQDPAGRVSEELLNNAESQLPHLGHTQDRGNKSIDVQRLNAVATLKNIINGLKSDPETYPRAIALEQQLQDKWKRIQQKKVQ